jgi:hypothetical protein
MERVNPKRLERLQRSLSRHLRDPSLRVKPYRDGLDCWVDLVLRRNGDLQVVRSAKEEQRATRYEGVVDFGDTIENDAATARLLRAAGLPTPAVLKWYRSNDLNLEPSWMLLEYIDHVQVDQLSEPTQTSLGKLTRRMHAIHLTPPDLNRLTPPVPWEEFIVKRIIARIDAARRYIQLQTSDRVRPALQAALSGRGHHARSLLHLDLRPPNLAIECGSGEIIALFDLSNAIAGDPYLEIARIRGCGILTPAFLAGYGFTASVLEHHGDVLNAYELDLAALLVVVSCEESTDSYLHERMAARTRELLNKILDTGPKRR